MRSLTCLLCALALALPPTCGWAAEIVLVASSFPKEILSAYKKAFDEQSAEYRVEFVNFPATNAVVHVHSTYATALACLGEGIPAFHYMVAVAGGDHIPCAAYATFGTPELARAIAALVPTLPAAAVLVLGGHEDGLLAFGPSLDAARAALAALRPQE